MSFCRCQGLSQITVSGEVAEEVKEGNDRIKSPFLSCGSDIALKKGEAGGDVFWKLG